jgi:Uma2 family endonuclease
VRQLTISSLPLRTLADLRRRLGGVPLDRIWYKPAPGTATEKDVLEAEARENRLCELVDGTLVEKAVGFEESRLAGRLISLINWYLEKNDLGICAGEGGMMRLALGLVRIPDVSFVARDKLPGRDTPSDPIPGLAPDLAVEVQSEGNTKPEMARKVREYFDAGTRLVWLIDHRKRTVRVFSSPDRSTFVRAHQSLDGGEVLPGFAVSVGELLDRGRRPRRS